MAARGDRVAIAWYTLGREQSPQVRVAFSDDGGSTFGAPITLDEDAPRGRPTIGLRDDRECCLVWLAGPEEGTQGARLVSVFLDGQGEVRQRVTLRELSGSRAEGFPELAILGDDVLVAWTEATPSRRVQLATLRWPPAGK